MIIFGVRASNIGNFNLPNLKCSYCDQVGNQRISVFGKFAHIFWIPFFSMGKEAIVECKHCKRTIDQKEFSPELLNLYHRNRDKFKNPIWHWLGLGFIGILISLFAIIGVTSEKDPKMDLLNNDIAKMSNNPSMDDDSISYKLKQVFDDYVVDEINPSEFTYLTKIEGEKVLVLVKIPKLKKVEKSVRNEVIELIEMVLDDQNDLMDKKRFIGVHGAFSMMLIKTPTYEQNSKFALTNELYNFYD